MLVVLFNAPGCFYDKRDITIAAIHDFDCGSFSRMIAIVWYVDDDYFTACLLILLIMTSTTITIMYLPAVT